MRTLSTNIVIDNSLVFNFVNSVEITSSYNNLTDTARIVFPKRLKFLDEDGQPLIIGADAVFKRGKPVYISAGYDQNTETIYNGYISGIKDKFPFEFNLEDGIYPLKQNSHTFALSNATLSEILKRVIPSGVTYTQTIDEVNLGKWRVTNASTAEVLDKLRRDHGIFSFFRDEGLFIGLAVYPKIQKTHSFKFLYNVIDYSNLEWRNEDDEKLKIKAVSIKSDNTKLEVEVGDKDGNTRTLYFFNINDEASLKAKAEAKINELKYTGFRGFFTTFLTPRVNHGDIIKLEDPQNSEKNGEYLVEKVVTSSGMRGGRQKIYIKQKI